MQSHLLFLGIVMNGFYYNTSFRQILTSIANKISSPFCNAKDPTGQACIVWLFCYTYSILYFHVNITTHSRGVSLE